MTTPATRVHEAVVEIWTETLGVEVTPDADFFLLGGHSLLATRMIARVEQTLGVKVRMRDVFDHAQLDDFVALVAERAAAQQ
ncbi:phosphopantetheine-binding protein [Kitasatospora viridis]|uniref:Acyl carrier protein n=1 Tax=Kitasatospora viridis TaxID=281105 RepID=A0A561UIP2_9ACTN|nr:phosphopantetheine-binding protein [Kitasatospora viridis]TWF99248.1 acyl carrier protein [Kitasatospora viridis]